MIKNYLSIKKFNNDKIKFGFFTSRGGVSRGNYFSLNCSKNNKDNKVNVSKNITIALQKLDLKNQKLKLINQIHSNKIFYINKKNFNNKIYGDGLAYEKFEVDKKFKFKFIQKNKSYSQFFKYKNKKKDLFNLRKLINYQFKNEGVSNVFNIRKDTYKNSQYFFSHRRATHKNQLNSGRMINIISLKD